MSLVLVTAAALVALVWLWLVVTPWDEPVLPLLVFVPVPAAVWWLMSRGGVGRVVMAGVWVVVVAVMLATVALSASGTVTRARYDPQLDAMTVASQRLLEGAEVPAESCGLAPVLDYGPLGVPVLVCVVTYDIGLAEVPTGGYGGDGTASSPVVAVDAVVAEPVVAAGSSDTIAVRQVRYSWGAERTGTTRELVFEAEVAQPPAGRCVRSVRSQWWAWLDNGSGCPRGFVSSSQ
jgi:hypothetical protein